MTFTKTSLMVSSHSRGPGIPVPDQSDSDSLSDTRTLCCVAPKSLYLLEEPKKTIEGRDSYDWVIVPPRII